MRGKRRLDAASPRSWRMRSSRSAESPRSSTLKSRARPRFIANSRSSRFAIEWKVPDQGRRMAPPRIPSARRVISSAARRVNVSSRMRAGSTPAVTRAATRCASVAVLPVPAPAMMRSAGAGASDPMPKATAARCASLSVCWKPIATTGILAGTCIFIQSRIRLRATPLCEGLRGLAPPAPLPSAG